MSQRPHASATPAIAKKLLAEELVDFKSSHVSEALAVSCGYATNAAYLTDLNSGVAASISLHSLDLEGFCTRLMHLAGQDSLEVKRQIASEFMRVGDRHFGDIVPLGKSSTVLPKMLAARQGQQIDVKALTRNLVAALPGRMFTSRASALLEAMIPVCIAWFKDCHASDIMEAVDLISLRHIAEENYGPELPERERHAILFYLTSLANYQPGTDNQSPITREQHALVMNIVLAGFSNATTDVSRLGGLPLMRPKRPLFNHTPSAKVDNTERSMLVASLQRAVRTAQTDIRTIERAHFLMETLIDLAAEMHPDGTLPEHEIRLSATLPYLIDAATTRFTPTSLRIDAYLRGLQGYSPDPASMTPALVVEHARVEQIIWDALGRSNIRQWFTMR